MYKSKRARATDIPKSVKDKVWERDKERCIYCGSPCAMPNAHYISREKGGLGVEQNIVTLCIKCHHAYDHGSKVQKETYAKQRGMPIIDDFIKAYLETIYGKINIRDITYHSPSKSLSMRLKSGDKHERSS